MGEHDVAVKFDQLKWSMAPRRQDQLNRQRLQNTDRNYPDHAVLNATKDQLKAMPNFEYSK